MWILLLTDITIENHPFAAGERVELSSDSGKLLIRKGFATEVKETKVTKESNDLPVGKHNDGSGKRKRNNGKR